MKKQILFCMTGLVSLFISTTNAFAANSVVYKYHHWRTSGCYAHYNSGYIEAVNLSFCKQGEVKYEYHRWGSGNGCYAVYGSDYMEAVSIDHCR